MAETKKAPTSDEHDAWHRAHPLGLTREQEDEWHRQHPTPTALTPAQHDTLMQKLGITKEQDDEWHRTHFSPEGGEHA